MAPATEKRSKRLLCPARVATLFGHDVELPAIPWASWYCLAIDPTGITPSYVDHIAADDYDAEQWRGEWDGGVDVCGNSRPSHFCNLLIAAEDTRAAGELSAAMAKATVRPRLHASGQIRSLRLPGGILELPDVPKGHAVGVMFDPLEEYAPCVGAIYPTFEELHVEWADEGTKPERLVKACLESVSLWPEEQVTDSEPANEGGAK